MKNVLYYFAVYLGLVSITTSPGSHFLIRPTILSVRASCCGGRSSGGGSGGGRGGGSGGRSSGSNSGGGKESKSWLEGVHDRNGFANKLGYLIAVGHAENAEDWYSPVFVENLYNWLTRRQLGRLYNFLMTLYRRNLKYKHEFLFGQSIFDIMQNIWCSSLEKKKITDTKVVTKTPHRESKKNDKSKTKKKSEPDEMITPEEVQELFASKDICKEIQSDSNSKEVEAKKKKWKKLRNSFAQVHIYSMQRYLPAKWIEETISYVFLNALRADNSDGIAKQVEKFIELQKNIYKEKILHQKKEIQFPEEKFLNYIFTAFPSDVLRRIVLGEKQKEVKPRRLQGIQFGRKKGDINETKHEATNEKTNSAEKPSFDLTQDLSALPQENIETKDSKENTSLGKPHLENENTFVDIKHGKVKVDSPNYRHEREVLDKFENLYIDGYAGSGKGFGKDGNYKLENWNSNKSVTKMFLFIRIHEMRRHLLQAIYSSIMIFSQFYIQNLFEANSPIKNFYEYIQEANRPFYDVLNPSILISVFLSNYQKSNSTKKMESQYKHFVKHFFNFENEKLEAPVKEITSKLVQQHNDSNILGNNGKAEGYKSALDVESIGKLLLRNRSKNYDLDIYDIRGDKDLQENKSKGGLEKRMIKQFIQDFRAIEEGIELDVKSFKGGMKGVFEKHSVFSLQENLKDVNHQVQKLLGEILGKNGKADLSSVSTLVNLAKTDLGNMLYRGYHDYLRGFDMDKDYFKWVKEKKEKMKGKKTKEKSDSEILKEAVLETRKELVNDVQEQRKKETQKFQKQLLEGKEMLSGIIGESNEVYKSIEREVLLNQTKLDSTSFEAFLNSLEKEMFNPEKFCSCRHNFGKGNENLKKARSGAALQKKEKEDSKSEKDTDFTPLYNLYNVQEDDLRNLYLPVGDQAERAKKMKESDKKMVDEFKEQVLFHKNFPDVNAEPNEDGEKKKTPEEIKFESIENAYKKKNVKYAFDDISEEK